MDRVENYFAAPPVRTLYDVVLMDETELRGESRGIQIGEQCAKIEILQETITSMWEEALPMPKIAKFTRSTIEDVQGFMRKIVGDDNMQLIEQQWKAGLTISDIARNMNAEVAFINGS